MLKRLLALAASPPTVTALRDHLGTLDHDLASAQLALEEATAAHGDRIVEASTDADLDKADRTVESARRTVLRLQAARTAVQARLHAAEAEEAGRSLEERWERAVAALARRDAAMRKMDSAARALAEAVAAAQVKAGEAFELMPVRAIGMDPLQPEFTALDREVDLLLSVYSDGAVGSLTSSSLWEYRRGPQFLDRVVQRTAYWLSANPTTTTRDTPPEAA